jgi:hypothetical protein
VVAKQAHHLLGLALAQEAVIDEDAGDLLAESTPPERPHSTLAPPTWARIRSIASSRKAAIDQSPVQPAMSRTKLRMRSAPWGVWATSGWNCTA